MNLEQKIILGAAIITTVGIGSCKKDLEEQPNPKPDIVYSDNLKIISEDETQNINYADEKTISFEQARTDLQEGDIVVAGYSEKTTLGEITEISPDKKTFELEPSSLEQAIIQGHERIEHVVQGESKGPIKFEINDYVLHDIDGDLSTTNDQILLNGYLEMIPKIIFDIAFNQGVEKVEFAVNVDMNSQLEITTPPGGLYLLKEKTFPGPHIPPFPIVICGVPGWVSPYAEVVVGIEGQTSEASISATDNIKFNSSIKYDRNNTPGNEWAFTNNLNNHQFTFDKFTAQKIDLHAKAYAKPEISFLIYSFLGPSFGVEGYLDAKRIGCFDNWWQLKGGINGEIGLVAKVLGQGIMDYDANFNLYEQIIKEGSGVANTEYVELKNDDGNIVIYPRCRSPPLPPGDYDAGHFAYIIPNNLFKAEKMKTYMGAKHEGPDNDLYLKLWDTQGNLLINPILKKYEEVNAGEWLIQDISNENIVIQQGDSIRVGIGQHLPDCKLYQGWRVAGDDNPNNPLRTWSIDKNNQGIVEIYWLDTGNSLTRLEGYILK